MLIDSFLFFNEAELVELRIKYLNNLVDYFVVVEADITHQGKKKGWNFPKMGSIRAVAFSTTSSVVSGFSAFPLKLTTCS